MNVCSISILKMLLNAFVKKSRPYTFLIGSEFFFVDIGVATGTVTPIVNIFFFIAMK
jgi:hypothetical protein